MQSRWLCLQRRISPLGDRASRPKGIALLSFHAEAVPKPTSWRGNNKCLLQNNIAVFTDTSGVSKEVKINHIVPNFQAQCMLCPSGFRVFFSFLLVWCGFVATCRLNGAATWSSIFIPNFIGGYSDMTFTGAAHAACL